MLLRKTVTIILIPLLFACKKPNKSSFTLITRNSYLTDNYNGISVYRDSETGKLMDGCYIVGDKINKWEEFNVTEGILNGDYIIFHKNGNIFSESKYLKGKLHGEEKTYSLSGVLSKVRNFSQGIPFGKNLSYFENGKIKSESKIQDEKIIESITYNTIGEIESQMFIEDGRKITQNIKAGKVFFEQISSTYDDFEAMKFYNEDGSLKIYLRMLEDDDKSFLIELNEDGDEIKRIDVKANPKEAMKYFEYVKNFQ